MKWFMYVLAAGAIFLSGGCKSPGGSPGSKATPAKTDAPKVVDLNANDPFNKLQQPPDPLHAGIQPEDILLGGVNPFDGVGLQGFGGHLGGHLGGQLGGPLGSQFGGQFAGIGGQGIFNPGLQQALRPQVGGIPIPIGTNPQSIQLPQGMPIQGAGPQGPFGPQGQPAGPQGQVLGKGFQPPPGGAPSASEVVSLRRGITRERPREPSMNETMAFVGMPVERSQRGFTGMFDRRN